MRLTFWKKDEQKNKLRIVVLGAIKYEKPKFQIVRNMRIKCVSEGYDVIGNTDKEYVHILKVIYTVKFIQSPKFDTSKLQDMSPKTKKKILNMKRASTEEKIKR